MTDENILQAIISGQFSVQIALIGALASLVVAFLTAYFTSSVERKKFQYGFVEKLYEKRYETYTKLLKITQEIGKDKSQVELHKKCYEEIKTWQAETGGFLLLSKKSLIEFDRLKNLLKKNPEKKGEYSEDQRKKLFQARNSLRGALRDDFDFFHRAERDFKK